MKNEVYLETEGIVIAGNEEMLGWRVYVEDLYLRPNKKDRADAYLVLTSTEGQAYDAMFTQLHDVINYFEALNLVVDWKNHGQQTAADVVIKTRQRGKIIRGKHYAGHYLFIDACCPEEAKYFFLIYREKNFETQVKCERLAWEHIVYLIRRYEFDIEWE